MRRESSIYGRTRAVVAGALLGTAMLTAAGVAAPAAAQDAGARAFDIPAQPLRDAIVLFSRQSGLQLTAEGGLTAGRMSSAVKGEQPPAEALGRLLAGTGLTWRWLDGGSVVLQPAPDASDGSVQLDTLRVEGAGAAAGIVRAGTGEGGDPDPFAIFRDPRPVVTVNRQRLDRIPQTSPADMFNGLTGVQMGNASLSSSFDPNVRGLQGHGRVKVLLDGTDTSQASRVTYAGNRTHNYVDPDFVAGIDVEKGPGLESGGLGGTISMRTFNAADIITDDSRQWGVRVRGTLGDNSGTSNETSRCQYVRTFDNGDPSRTTLLNNLNSTTAERCKSGAVIEVPASRWNPAYSDTYGFIPFRADADVPSVNASGSLIAAYRPSDGFDVVAGYSKRQSGNYSAGRNGVVDRDYPSNGGFYHDGSAKDSFSYWQPGQEIYGTFTDSQSVLAKARAAFGDHSLLAKFNHFESRYVQHANTGAQVAPGVLDFFPPASRTQQQRYGLDYAWQPDNDWIGLRADLWKADTREKLYLGEFAASETPQNVKTKSFGFGLSNTSYIPLFTRQLTLKIGGQYKQESLESDTEVNGLETRLYGLFLSGSLPVVEWITLDGGLRYDHYKATLDPEQSYRFAEDNSDGGTSFHAGITLQPAEPLQFFVRHAEGWRAPSARENTLNNCNGGAEPYQTRPNGPIYYRCVQGLMKPERSRSFEFGTNLMFENLLERGDRLGIRLSRFNNNIRDYIFGSGTSVLPLMNIERAIFVGYEVSVSYDAGWVFADYGYTNNDRVEFCGTTYPTSTLPPAGCVGAGGWGDLFSQYVPATHRHNGTLGVRLLDRKLTVGGNATLVRGTGWDFDGMRRYEVYDLFASYEHGPLTFGLSAENIGDRYYFEAGTGAAWPLPAPGRMVRGTLTFHY
ncbi:TonB-dependent receptor [Sandaracinobacter sp. RS1-74]|uniref:TonB-dependent receptor n=1 Tax=Sandaracinobacteroides sayramensis TaxID=2913411 RepID=UPI001EDBB843|nr:TonB-dependent receptor [Sandaracinobacteroides sayramensis]MCG2842820.1 TonB-dependent receptor [Sandaracinobacteroides sayramensis]